MSDTENRDLSMWTESQLRTDFDRLTQAIETLRAEAPTVDIARSINALRAERNSVATAINELHELAAAEGQVEDTPLVDQMVDAGETVAEALAEAPAEAPAAGTGDRDVDGRRSVGIETGAARIVGVRRRELDEPRRGSDPVERVEKPRQGC